jgi:hypothetical protein
MKTFEKASAEVYEVLIKMPLRNIHWIGINFAIIAAEVFLFSGLNKPQQPLPDLIPAVGHLNVGTRLFIHDTQTFVGTIRNISEDYVFGDGKSRKAIEIQSLDGTSVWIPRDAANRLYLVERQKS